MKRYCFKHSKLKSYVIVEYIQLKITSKINLKHFLKFRIEVSINKFKKTSKNIEEIMRNSKDRLLGF